MNKEARLEPNDTPEPKKGRGWKLQWIAGLALTGLAVFVLSRMVKWADLKNAFASVPPSVILLVFLIYVVSFGFRAMAWQVLLQRRVSFWRTFLTLGEGYLLNTILPFRLGEFGRAYLMGRRTGMGMMNVLPTIFLERAFDLAFAAALLLAALPFALRLEWARGAAVLVLLVIFGLLAGLYVAGHNRARIENWVGRMGERSGLVKGLILPQLHAVLDGFAVLTRFDLFLQAFIALGISWAIAIGRDWVILNALSPDGAPFWWAFLAISVSNLVGALPSMAASLGTFEAGATSAMVMAGAAPEVGLAYGLIIHIVHILLTSAIGLIGLTQEGKNLGALLTEIRGIRVRSA